MTWAVETPLRVGDVFCCVIAVSDVSVRHRGRAVTGSAEKQPVLVLVVQDNIITGMDMQGRRYDADEIERLYPSAISELTAQIAEAS